MEPEIPLSHIYIKAKYVGSTAYFGNVLIDNIQVEILDPTPPKEEADPSEKTALLEGCTFDIPNIFTPNGDDKNETFKLVSNNIENIVEFQFEIINRWGQTVFTSSEPFFEWNGYNNNGEQNNDGIYFWSINYACYNNEEFERSNQKGWVTLIR